MLQQVAPFARAAFAAVTQCIAQPHFDLAALRRRSHSQQLAVLACGVRPAISLCQQRCVHLEVAIAAGQARPLRNQFGASLLGFRAERHGQVEMPQNLHSLRRIAAVQVGMSERKLGIGPRGRTIRLQEVDRLQRPARSHQRLAIDRSGVIEENRIRAVFRKVLEGCNYLIALSAAAISQRLKVPDVIGQFAGVRSCLFQRRNCLGVFTVQDVRVTDRQPRHASRIRAGMLPRILLHPGVGSRSACLDQLMGHRLQRCRSHECARHALDARRVCPLFGRRLVSALGRRGALGCRSLLLACAFLLAGGRFACSRFAAGVALFRRRSLFSSVL